MKVTQHPVQYLSYTTGFHVLNREKKNGFFSLTVTS